MASLAEDSQICTTTVSTVEKALRDGLGTLAEIWRDVGLSPTQQRKILQDLGQTLCGKVETLVKEEGQIRTQYLNEIQNAKKRSDGIVERLGLQKDEVGEEPLNDNKESTVRDLTDNFPLDLFLNT